MHTIPILEYLQAYGQKLDSEIAEAMRISLKIAQISLSDLSARGDIISCRVTRFKDGKPVHGILCRVSGSTPPTTPGRKVGATA